MSTPLRVLIVEDSEDDAILMLHELRRAGYEPTSERVDTPEAMNAALDHQTWDIVLSDYAMPCFSMPAALAMVKEKGLDLPFIIVSGAIGEEAAVAAMRAGAHDYVMKDNLARLAPAIERELREAEVRREHKRVEQALRESEEHYSALVGNLTDAVFQFKGGVVIWCNDRVEEIYGYPKDEILGKNASFFYPSDISPSEFTTRVAAAIKQRGFFRSTSKFQKKDGSLVDIEYSLSQIPGKDPVEMVAVARDVSERKQAEEALRRSEEHFRSLIENAQDAIVILNDDGTIRYESPSMERMTGREAKHRIGRDPFEFSHPDDIPNVIETFSQLLENQTINVHTELRLRHDDGSWRTFEVVATNLLDNAAVAGVVLNLRDITERKRAEEALQESEERYRMLAENITDVILTMDMNLRFTYVSPSVTRMRGYSVEEAIALTLEETLAPASFEVALKALAEEMAIEKMEQKDLTRSRKIEVELYCKDRFTIWGEAEMTFLRDPDGQAVGILGVVRDITERKKADEERKRLEQQLQLAGRMAAVGELAAGVAHELNNPLAAVQAFAQFLADKDNLDKTIKSDVETIYREAQRATRITTNLLRFARRQKPEKHLISINETLERSLQLHAYRMKLSNIEVLAEPDPDLPMTMADSDQMHQVFVNIITNAEQAMTEAHSKGKLRVKTQRVGEMIRIAFTDDGPGISEDSLKRIFDPFFTTKEVGGGTGLGLSICYGVVEEHGGHMYARSKPGKGATFVVELPIASDDQPVAEQAGSIKRWKA